MSSVNKLQRVVVTGMGAVTPIGCGVQKSWDSLLQGAIGIRKTSFDNFVCSIGGMVPDDFDPKQHESSLGPSIVLSMANAVCDEALQDAGIDTRNMTIDRDRFGVSISQMAGSWHYNVRQTNPQFYSKREALKGQNIMLPAMIALKHQLFGPVDCSQQGCASGLFTIGNSFRLIKHGYLDAAVAGGVDTNLGNFHHNFVENMGVVNITSNTSPQQAVRPFDQHRNGTVLADGGGVVILESLDSAKRRNAKIYSEIVGFHSAGEAHHPTAPAPNGLGTYKAILGSLLEANLRNGDIDVINAGAAGTIVGDASEANGIKFLLGTQFEKLVKESAQYVCSQNHDDLDSDKFSRTYITAHKGNIGQLVAGAGAVESIFALKCLETNMLPKIANMEFPCDPLLRFVKGENQKLKLNVVVKTSLGLGNMAGSIIFKKFED